MEKYRSWLALKQVDGIGNVLYKRLIDFFGTPEAVFSAGEEDLEAIEGLSKRLIQSIQSFNDFQVIDRELEQIEKHGVALLTLNAPAYPALLSAIYDPPPVLYIKGCWQDLSPYPIAVVGARKASPYGKKATERLCQGLIKQGVTIVSGFARGIDGIAHRSALAGGGETLAVLGCGIDVVYPPEHRRLFDEVLERGAIFSEFAMGTAPIARNFPKRNRIISGLSLGCVVIEASQKSGSLITARLALEQGREVFAVPGSIFSDSSAGPHQLIASGAKLVQNAEDILSEVLPQLKTRASRSESEAPELVPVLEGEEAVLYQSLSFEPKHIDLLIEESGKRAACVSGLLLGLELKGAVRQMAGQYYVKV